MTLFPSLSKALDINTKKRRGKNTNNSFLSLFHAPHIAPCRARAYPHRPSSIPIFDVRRYNNWFLLWRSIHHNEVFHWRFNRSRIEGHSLYGSLGLGRQSLLTEASLREMTWKGHKGFQHSKMTAGDMTPIRISGLKRQVGRYHSERGMNYVAFSNAGHMVPEDEPVGAFWMLEKIILGK
jgi:hypothetical protein